MRVMILLFLVALIILSGCVEEKINTTPVQNNTSVNLTTYDYLERYLGNNQRIDYTADYRFDWVAPDGTAGNYKYNVAVADEKITKGIKDSLTATKIREKIKDQVSFWSKDEIDSIKSFDFPQNEKCFYGKSVFENDKYNKDFNSFVVCFDEESNLIFYGIFTKANITWRIKDSFNYSNNDILSRMIE